MQIRAHSSGGFSQLRCSAGHHSATASASQPGSSDQSALTQRERVRCITTGGAVGAGLSTAGGTDAGVAGGGLTGALAQAASTPRIAAAAKGRTRNGVFIMGLLLLEALAALVVLVLIVWWTMFSGRKGGERESDGDGDDGGTGGDES
jgi:hypothetical protein